jgi:hypothetical protein
MGTDITKRDQMTVDPFEQLANEESSVTLVKFSKGEWTIAGELANGIHLVAHMTQLIKGWRKWKDREIVDTNLGYVAERFQPKERDELGDLDQDHWPLGPNGAPKDPWEYGLHLLLSDHEGRRYKFSAISKGGRNAIGDLSARYRKRLSADALPIVSLETTGYRHPTFGKVDVPLLKVVDWTNGASNAEPATELPVSITSGPPQRTQVSKEGPNESDPNEGEYAPLEDDIPF